MKSVEVYCTGSCLFSNASYCSAEFPKHAFLWVHLSENSPNILFTCSINCLLVCHSLLFGIVGHVWFLMLFLKSLVAFYIYFNVVLQDLQSWSNCVHNLIFVEHDNIPHLFLMICKDSFMGHMFLVDTLLRIGSTSLPVLWIMSCLQ